MLKRNKLKVLSIAVASLLTALVTSAASTYTNQSHDPLGHPKLLTADAAVIDDLPTDTTVVSYFLKIDGIDGESTNVNYPGYIEIDEFSWGLSNPATAAIGGAPTLKPTLQDFHFAAHTSKASPKLFQACATGEHFVSALLVAVRTDVQQQQQEFMKFTLKDPMISSYQTGNQAEGDSPEDTFSLNYSAVEFSYKPQNPDGTLGNAVVGSYDLKQGGKA